jgi:hypothetical protein
MVGVAEVFGPQRHPEDVDVAVRLESILLISFGRNLRTKIINDKK